MSGTFFCSFKNAHAPGIAPKPSGNICAKRHDVLKTNYKKDTSSVSKRERERERERERWKKQILPRYPEQLQCQKSQSRVQSPEFEVEGE